MKINIKILCSIAIFAPLSTFALPILTIAPSLSNVTIPYNGVSSITYTVTNNLPVAVQNISQPDFKYKTTSTYPAGLTLPAASDNCTGQTLAASTGSCTFLVRIASQTASFVLTPRVCINNQECSVAAASSFTTTVEPQPAHNVYAYVVPRSGSYANRLVSVDPTTASIINSSLVISVTGSEWAQGIAVSTDGTRTYVVTDTSTTDVVNTSTSTPALLTTFTTVSTNPVGITVTPNGSFVYVTGRDDGKITLYNVGTATASAAATMPGVSPSGYGIDVSDDGGTLAAVDKQNGLLDIYTINSTTGALTFVRSVTVGTNPRSVSISPDGTQAYVSNQNAGGATQGTVTAIILSTGVATTISNGVTGFNSPEEIAFSKDGLTAYVVSLNSNIIYVINTITKLVTTTISASTGPIGIGLDPTQTYLIASSYGSSNVDIFNLSNSYALTSVNVGGTQNTVGGFIG